MKKEKSTKKVKPLIGAVRPNLIYKTKLPPLSFPEGKNSYGNGLARIEERLKKIEAILNPSPEPPELSILTFRLKLMQFLSSIKMDVPVMASKAQK